MARSIVLVAAPDAAFRRSIVFVLASEGYETDAHLYATDALASIHADQAGCAVIDDEAVENWQETPALFEHFPRPVILLVSLSRTMPDVPLFKSLKKPFLGKPLINAVHQAIAGGMITDT